MTQAVRQNKLGCLTGKPFYPSLIFINKTGNYQNGTPSRYIPNRVGPFLTQCL